MTASRWRPTCRFRDSEFDTNSSRCAPSACRRQFVSTSTRDDGIPSWHFDDDAEMLDPRCGPRLTLYQNRGGSKGDAVTLPARRRLRFGDRASSATELRRALRRSRRFAIVQPAAGPARSSAARSSALPEGSGLN